MDRGQSAISMRSLSVGSPQKARQTAMRIPSSSGERQNFNVINDIGDTFHPFHDVPDLGPEVGLRYLADERDRAAVDRKSEVVEHAKVQKHHQLVPDLIWRFRSLARIGLRRILMRGNLLVVPGCSCPPPSPRKERAARRRQSKSAARERTGKSIESKMVTVVTVSVSRAGLVATTADSAHSAKPPHCFPRLR
jgi:hypothetical protein